MESVQLGHSINNFTTIVGPNGSGKSNLIECLLFVFGKRAKKMRVNTNIGDLIHNSSFHPNETEAYVEVNFQYILDYIDDDNKYDVIENSHFSVKREVKRSSQSSNAVSNYYINNEKKKFNELEEFLIQEHCIDLDHDRFLILQGEVESISMMPAKGAKADEVGLLEYLEDIIGSSKYTQQVEEMEKLVEQRREEKIVKENDLLSIKNNIMNMHNEKDQAFDYVKKDATCKKLLLLKDYATFGKVRVSQEKLAEQKDKVSLLFLDNIQFNLHCFIGIKQVRNN